ncbi:MAG: Ig-like domain-containing protein [Flavobacteriales bacterium]|jgi:hypothetical protein
MKKKLKNIWIFSFSFGLFLTSCSKVTEVKIKSNEKEVVKGESLQLQAVVKGEGNPDSTVNWEILESLTGTTTISDNGLLTIDESEEATSITVKAFSKQDTSKSAQYQLNLILSPDLFFGKWSSEVGGVKRILELNNNRFSQTYIGQDYFYSVKDCNWTPAINDDPATKAEFPQGYLCNGVYEKAVRVLDEKNQLIRTGTSVTNKFYLNKDKSKILRFISDDLEGVVWSRKSDD